MKAAFSVLFLVAACAQLSFGAGKADIKKALEAKDKEFITAFNNKDVAGCMASYWKSPQLVAFYPDSEYMGYDAVQKSWQNLFNQMVEIKFDVTDSHLMVVSDNYAYEWGHFSFDFKPKGAPEMVKSKGRYLEVWEKKDGKWVLTVDHASSPLPAPPQPAETGGMK
jgi:ketosteroid isomerase-like protein